MPAVHRFFFAARMRWFASLSLVKACVDMLAGPELEFFVFFPRHPDLKQQEGSQPGRRFIAVDAELPEDHPYNVAARENFSSFGDAVITLLQMFSMDSIGSSVSNGPQTLALSSCGRLFGWTWDRLDLSAVGEASLPPLLLLHESWRQQGVCCIPLPWLGTSAYICTKTVPKRSRSW